MAEIFAAGPGRALVRGAGVVGRSRRAATMCASALPPRMEIAAGEYGYRHRLFPPMLSAGAVDVQQADATRCGGVTGFLQVAALCAKPITSIFPRIARRRCICTSAARRRGSATRMVSRPRPHRAHAVRRRAGSRQTA